jgi:hypothetical protein
MKFLSTKFEDYINECEKFNLHEDLYKILKKNPYKNLLFYGPSGVGKYTQSLNFIKRFSPSHLKYERKMNYNFNNKKEYVFKVSDIHIEIDMCLLGCNAKVLFNDLYYHILDIFSTREKKFGIILLKNFHKIHKELLENFYSYMQSLEHKNMNLTYIILSEQISFIPKNILNRCDIISVGRPTKQKYSKCISKQIKKKINVNKINNIKDLKFDIVEFMDDDKYYTDLIIENIESYEKINFLEFRDILYDVLIFHINIEQIIYNIITHFIKMNKLNIDSLENVYTKLYIFLKQYNNNYRPIYHLENYMYYLCKVIHGL